MSPEERGGNTGKGRREGGARGGEGGEGGGVGERVDERWREGRERKGARERGH